MKAAHSFKVVDGKILEIKPNKHAGKPDKGPSCKVIPVVGALIQFRKCDRCRSEETESDQQSFSA